MPKVLLNVLGVFIFLGFLQGCSTSKERSTEHYTIRSYIQEKQRVDQEIDTQAAIGNWSNAPLATDPERKKTRKMYVLEVTEKVDDLEVDAPAGTNSGTDIQNSTEGEFERTEIERKMMDDAYEAPDVDLPSYSEKASKANETGAGSGTVFTDYTVEKDDTLQKISKKFFGSYSKWPQIYEANKDQISNPDFLKPGIKIKVPVPNEK